MEKKQKYGERGEVRGGGRRKRSGEGRGQCGQRRHRRQERGGCSGDGKHGGPETCVCLTENASSGRNKPRSIFFLYYFPPLSWAAGLGHSGGWMTRGLDLRSRELEEEGNRENQKENKWGRAGLEVIMGSPESMTSSREVRLREAKARGQESGGEDASVRPEHSGS